MESPLPRVVSWPDSRYPWPSYRRRARALEIPIGPRVYLAGTGPLGIAIGRINPSKCSLFERRHRLVFDRRRQQLAGVLPAEAWRCAGMSSCDGRRGVTGDGRRLRFVRGHRGEERPWSCSRWSPLGATRRHMPMTSRIAVTLSASQEVQPLVSPSRGSGPGFWCVRSVE